MFFFCGSRQSAVSRYFSNRFRQNKVQTFIHIDRVLQEDFKIKKKLMTILDKFFRSRRRVCDNCVCRECEYCLLRYQRDIFTPLSDSLDALDFLFECEENRMIFTEIYIITKNEYPVFAV